jgi:hypothetical protein
MGMNCDGSSSVGVGLGAGVGEGVEDWQATPMKAVAMRSKVAKNFGMTTVVYDLLLGKVNYSHIEVVYRFELSEYQIDW